MKPARPKAAAHPAEAQLRAVALSFPETHEDFPWGESAFKVKGKVFLFMYVHAEGIKLSLKLPESRERALASSFAEPTGYGLGKSGWVTSNFDRYERVPIDTLVEWIGESYRAVAPKKLVAALDRGGATKSAPPEKRKTRSKKAATKRAVRKSR